MPAPWCGRTGHPPEQPGSSLFGRVGPLACEVVRRRRAIATPNPSDRSIRVLIVSASMGAGHDGAARSLAEQLRAEGHVVDVRDFLRSGPLRIGSALRSGYEFELRHAPSAYDATYRFWYRVPWLCPFVAWLVTLLTRRRLLRWVEDFRPTAVVSTYPLSTLCLGRLRRTGRLRVPAVNFVTDFGVHPLWVHRGVDLNLTIHDEPALVAARRTGRPAEACGPAVSSRFDPDHLPARAEARDRFGLSDDQRAVLIVAGSWGVGNVGDTFESIARDGRFLPVVVCGRDERLRRHIETLALSHPSPSLVIGWTDEMPALMAACDALVENAGGLTSLEAMRAGLPVVSFDPIAGHGKENTAAMNQVGVARLAGDPAALVEALADLTAAGPERDRQVARASAMFRRSPARAVVDLAAAGVEPVSAARRRARRAARVGVAGVATGATVWAGLTTGVAMATEAGAGVAHPGVGAAAVAYIGVRLDPYELATPAVSEELRRMGATAVVDEATAEADPAAVRALVGDGVSVANGGLGHLPGTDVDGIAPWDRAAGDARAVTHLSDLIDAPVTEMVPGRRLTAWDLVECRRQHVSLVVPNHVLHASAPADQPIRIDPGHIYVVSGMGASPEQLTTFLSRLEASLAADQLAAAPLTTLA